MKFGITFIFFLFWGWMSVLAQTNEDSLRITISDKSSTTVEKVEALILLMETFSGRSRQDSLQKYSAIAVDLARLIDDDRKLIEALRYLTMAYDRVDSEKAIQAAQEYLELSQKAGYKEGEFLALKDLSDFDSDGGNYQESLNKLNAAVEILMDLYEETGERKYAVLKGQYSHNISIRYYRLQLFEKSIEQDQINQKHAIAIGDDDLLFRSYQSLASNYDALAGFASETGAGVDKENYQQRSLEYARKTVELARGMGNKRYTGYALSTLGNVYLEIGKLDSAAMYMKEAVQIADEMQEYGALANRLSVTGLIYSQQNSYELAISYFEQARNLAKERNYPAVESRALLNLIDHSMYLNRLNDAIQYGNEELELARRLNRVGDISKAYLGMSRAYEKLGNFELAYKNHLLHSQYKDSVINTENLERIEELQTQYETEKKEQEIANLAQQNQIQSLQLRQRNSLIAGIVALLLFVIIGAYFMYRHRVLQEHQETMNARQRLLRVQMNPHFMFNALTAIENFILEHQDVKQAVIYLSRFSALMRAVLEQSREDLIPLSEELFILEKYLELQQIRSSGSFDYQTEVDNELQPDGVFVPPMFAQPFIENAIEHGISGKKSGGKIDISFRVENDFLKLIVKDNGIGIGKSRKSGGHQSLATSITEERIALLKKITKKEFSFSISDLSESNGEISGTQVIFKLPLVYSRS